jgi:hypothetical protein
LRNRANPVAFCKAFFDGAGTSIDWVRRACLWEEHGLVKIIPLEKYLKDLLSEAKRSCRWKIFNQFWTVR